MAFETFSLAEVLQNAELINQTRGRSNLDLLRGAATRENIETSRLSRRVLSRQLEREESVFDADKQRTNTKFLIGATNQILASDNPVAVAEQLFIEAKRRGITLTEQFDASSFDIEQIQQINTRAKIALGESPQALGRIKVGANETIIDDDGNVIFSNFDPSVRIDKETEIRLKKEEGLRKEFNTLLRDFNLVADSFARVKAAAVDPSAAGDLAMIFNYMKMLDPGSTVREGEFATAQQSTGLPGRVVTLYNKITEGQRLNADQRNDFLDRANKLFEAARSSAGDTATAYEQIAVDAGVNPANIIAVFEQRKGPGKVTLTPGPRALEHLRNNPETLSQFIEKYGESAVPSGTSR